MRNIGFVSDFDRKSSHPSGEVDEQSRPFSLVRKFWNTWDLLKNPSDPVGTGRCWTRPPAVEMQSLNKATTLSALPKPIPSEKDTTTDSLASLPTAQEEIEDDLSSLLSADSDPLSIPEDQSEVLSVASAVSESDAVDQIFFRRTEAEEKEQIDDAPRATGLEIHAEKRDGGPLHFRKIFTYQAADGSLRQAVFSVSLNESQKEKAEKHYTNLIKRYPNLLSFDLQHLMALVEEDTVHFDAKDEDIQALRDLFDEIDDAHKKIQWPHYEKSSRGDLHGPRSLQAPDGRAKEMAQWNVETTLEHLDKYVQVEEPILRKFFLAEKFLKGIDECVEDLKRVKRGKIEHETSASEKEILAAQLRNVEQFSVDWKAMSPFAIFSTLALEPQARTTETFDHLFASYSSLLEGMKGELLDNYLYGTLLRQRDQAATPQEQEFLKDLAFLSTRDKGEYLTLSKKKAHPIKKDPLEWAVLQTVRYALDEHAEKAVSAWVEHPLFKRQNLDEESVQRFTEFVRGWASSLETYSQTPSSNKSLLAAYRDYTGPDSN